MTCISHYISKYATQICIMNHTYNEQNIITPQEVHIKQQDIKTKSISYTSKAVPILTLKLQVAFETYLNNLFQLDIIQN